MTAASLLLAIAGQLSISVAATDTVPEDGIAELRVRVVAPRARGVEIVPPSFRPFLLARSSARERVERDARGVRRAVVEYRYALAPTSDGSFLIPAFRARSGQDSVVSQPVTIVVRRGPRGSLPPAIVSMATIDTGALVNFRVLAFPDTIYVGQQANYQLGVFLEQSVRDRLRRMEAIAPEMRGMLAYEPPPPASGFPLRTAGARRYDVHVYQRAVFPLAPGRHVIPPARLIYSMPLSYSFFSREEGFELTSDSAVLEVIELPSTARPGAFRGAVGKFEVTARLDTAGARVGDPLPLTVRVSGTGNVKLLPRPPLSVPWGLVVSGGERVQIDRNSRLVRGSKEFDWLLTPQRSGKQVLPAIIYAYFDPESARYDSAVTYPDTFLVAEGALAAADSGKQGATKSLALRSIYRGELATPLYTRRGFWFLMAAAPLPAAFLAALRRSPQRSSRRMNAARSLRLLTRRRRTMKHFSPELARGVRRAFLYAIAERLGVAAVGIAEPEALARVARLAGTTSETAESASALLGELNHASFNPGASFPAQLSVRVHDVYERIDREACRPAPKGKGYGIPALALIIAATASIASAAVSSPAAEIFFRGVGKFQSGHFRAAMKEFSTVVGRAPRAPDAWANLGTSSWAAGDTASAAVAWQRALRLEPAARDVRARLEFLAASTGGRNSTVPALPVEPVAVVAAILWLIACSLLAISRVRREAGLSSPAFWLSGAAVVLAVAAASGDAALASRHAAVIERGGPLRVLPALGGERSAMSFTGEVVRVVEQRPGWAFVTVERGRDGWIESPLLTTIARD
ncbi:MAG: hypothetical protein ABR543_01280 [Gemmatimonadaceae bacterium]